MLTHAVPGAGPSGICTAVQLQRLLGHQNFHIYERSAGLGGVWFNNTYPGCAVDIPAHYYSYSFALKPDWPKLYPDRTHLYNCE
jgi:cation diffusion facilitator CzcD-associated flavoprotein CzcO